MIHRLLLNTGQLNPRIAYYQLPERIFLSKRNVPNGKKAARNAHISIWKGQFFSSFTA